MLGRMPNWKSPGPHLVQGFWLNNFSSLHEGVRLTGVKLLTGAIANQIYTHLDQEKLLPEEQKGYKKGSRETSDLLYIDRAVTKDVKSRNKNLANGLDRL